MVDRHKTNKNPPIQNNQNEPKYIVIDTHLALRKQYKIRRVGREELNFIVSMPGDVINRQARLSGLTTDEFIQQYRAIAMYNGTDGVYYTFKYIKGGNET